jgi:hypothetical protein
MKRGNDAAASRFQLLKSASGQLASRTLAYDNHQLRVGSMPPLAPALKLVLTFTTVTSFQSKILFP